jgi:hypothetical protein
MARAGMGDGRTLPDIGSAKQKMLKIRDLHTPVMLTGEKDTDTGAAEHLQ